MRRLVTIGVSHFCEKARWALDRAGLPFEEVACAPVLHVPSVRWAGGTRATPVLVDGDLVIDDSTAILDHVQAHPASRWRPWPDGPVGDEARALEARFDAELGPHVRRWIYHHLLPDRAALLRVLAPRTPAGQLRAFALGLPLFRAVMRRSMAIDAAGASRSHDRYHRVLDDVDARLADGRRYLAGDAFSGADLAFAALAAPGVLPARYLPVTLDGLPAAIREEVERLRERPSGRFVARLYDEDR